ncbi:MAG: hypothetical protein R6X20_13520 [Phycisphaerae bacterium]
MMDVGPPADVADAADVPLLEAPEEASGGGTARILTEPGEVVYCACFGRYGLAGHYPHFDTACFRASRRVYEATPQPWFDFACDATRTRFTVCQCAWFLCRLPPAMKPKRAGRVGRLTETVAAPAGFSIGSAQGSGDGVGFSAACSAAFLNSSDGGPK